MSEGDTELESVTPESVIVDLLATVSIAAKGTPFSIYGTGDATYQSRRWWTDLKVEVGGRAFRDPNGTGLLPLIPGPWAIMSGELRRRGTPVEWRTTGNARIEAWPGLQESVRDIGLGALVRRGDHVWTADVRGGGFNAWFTERQRPIGERWFGPGKPFLDRYRFVRLDLQHLYNSTDRAVMPTRGIRWLTRVTPLGHGGSQFFVRAETDARFFATVPLGLIVSSRFRLGVLGRAGGDGALMGERFFMGRFDVQGWGIRTIVPPDYDGDRFDVRIGGDSVGFGHLQLAREWNGFAAGTFVEAGRVWEARQRPRFRDLLADVGLWVQPDTRWGRVRLGVVARLTRQDIDDAGFAAVLTINPEYQ